MDATTVTKLGTRLYVVDTGVPPKKELKPERQSVSRRYLGAIRAAPTKLAYFAVIALTLAGTAREVEGYTVTQLTNEPSYEGQPAWSPDGSKIAFVSDRDGNRALYVMDANGSNQRRLIDSEIMWNNEWWDDEDPDWSADGSKIVFSSAIGRDYDIWTVDVNTEDPLATLTRLTESISDERIPAWRYDDEILYYAGPSSLWWGGTICKVNPEDSSRTALANGNWPSWSSEGTKILFSILSGDDSGIYTIDPNGENQQLLSFTGYGRNLEPTWSPNGSKIVFSITDRFSPAPEMEYFPNLYMMDKNGSNIEKLTSDEYSYCFMSGTMQRRSPTWSPDGTKIAFHYKGDIWVMSGLGLTADLQHDGIVNLRDFAVIAEYWLQNEPSADIAPHGGDGEVNFLDVAKLAEEWLQKQP